MRPHLGEVHVLRSFDGLRLPDDLPFFIPTGHENAKGRNHEKNTSRADGNRQAVLCITKWHYLTLFQVNSAISTNAYNLINKLCAT